MLSRGEHAEARPLRLDSPLVFQSVAATNCLQNYNKIRNVAINLKNNSRIGESHLAQSCFHYKSTIIPTNMPALPIFAEKLGHDRYGEHENN